MGKFIRWLFLMAIVCLCLEALGYWGLWLNSGKTDYLTNKNYFNIRAMLMGNGDTALLPRYLSLPHLGYVPYPGYSNGGYLQHNEDGYRGNRVPVKKTNRFRILCMGGSTTYGWGVTDPSETYPAQLEKMVSDYIREDALLSKKYVGAEVINAGVEAAGSAEELQQYLFKYRYYASDVVILHTGVNDALMLSSFSDDFQFDYTHFRRLNFHLEPLPQPARFMLHSYFFSLLTIQLYYHDFSSQGDEFSRKEKDKYISWSDVDIDSAYGSKDLSLYPFYRNTRSLCSEAKADGAAVFLLPNVLNIHSAMVKSSPKYSEITAYNDSLMKGIAAETGAEYIPFTFGSIRNPKWWLDDCHVNAAGEKNKAEIIFPFVKRVLDDKIAK